MSLYDREPNFEDTFAVGDRFVVTDLRYTGTIRTKFGDAHRCLITIVTRDGYPKRETYSVIGAGFKNLAERATRGDFPHVAEYVRVELSGGRDVKRLALVMDGDERLDPRAFVNGTDGDPIDVNSLAPGDGGAPAEDDIPF